MRPTKKMHQLENAQNALPKLIHSQLVHICSLILFYFTHRLDYASPHFQNWIRQLSSLQKKEKKKEETKLIMHSSRGIF